MPESPAPPLRAVDPDQRPQRSVNEPQWLEPREKDGRDGVHAWEAHLAAGRIGTRPPVDPAVTENRARTEALFRARAKRHRADRQSIRPD